MESSAKSLENPILKNVIEKKLKSNLTVLFYPYKREDVATIKLCVKVGSVYETDSQAGITHLIEHMIFKGTETKKPEDIVGAIEKKGGYMNAFTSYDYTCYYVAGPSNIIETALDILSDVVFHPYFDPEELKKEKEVVIEEMKMRLDNPMTVLFENVMKASYRNFPYYRPIIGFPETVRSFTRKNLLDYVNEFYTPENMVLVIVGNITENKLFPLVEKYFSNLPKRKLKKIEFPEEPYTEKPELIWIERPVKEGYFVFTLPGPSIKSNDAPILDLIAEILGGGKSSRLYVKLKRELGLVKSISASSFTPTGPGLFEIYGTADPENFLKIIKETLKELEKLKENGVEDEELEKAKIQILSDFTFSQETSQGLSGVLASFQLTRGTYKDIAWYKEIIRKTTPEDIKKVAKKYFNYQKLVAGFLSEKKLFDEKTLIKTISSFKFTSTPEIFKMNNGLEVILYPLRDIPTISICLAFPGGLRFETKETNGLFKALTLLWTRGTKNYSAEELAEKLESIGAEISGFSGRNTFGLRASFLSSKLDEALKYFSEILLKPAFSKDECKKAKPELLSFLLKQEDQPMSLAIKDFLQELFPDHPYGLNSAGSYEFYQRFTCEDLKSAYKKFVNPKKGVLVIIGDFDPYYLKAKLFSLLKDWKQISNYKVEEKEPTLPKEKIKKIKKETFQTQILLGFQTPGLNSKEMTALEVLNSALSGQDGRLYKILRDERALAYAVTSFLIFYPKKSAFIFYIACSPEKKESAISGFWEILEDISKNGLTQEEIERAKNRLIGEEKLSLQSNLSKAEDMAVNEVLGLGWDYYLKYEKLVNEVTHEGIKNLINKYLTKDKSVLLILGK